MGWSDVIGQDRVAGMLSRAIQADRVAHAYLFHGPDGVGKRAMALEFARALECERGLPEACGTCGPCGKVARLIHPDVHLLFPYPTDTSAGDVAERTRLLAANPYEELDYVRRPSLADAEKASNKQVIYPIKRIHEEVRHVLGFRSHEGRYKVTVMIDCDALNPQAANALLKILEEPTDRTVFVLTTSRVDRLIPTIVSRCQRVRFDMLTADEIRTALVSRMGMPEHEAELRARMADGSYSRALRLAGNPELTLHRNKLIDLLRHVYTGADEKTIELVEEFAGLGREQLKGVLLLLLQWVRDVLLQRDLGDDASVANVDQRAALTRFVANLPTANLESMTAVIESAQWLLERNVNLMLLLLNLADALAHCMKGEALQSLSVSLIEPEMNLA